MLDHTAIATLSSDPVAARLLRDDVALDREICERSLHEFIRHFWAEMDPSPFVDGWHLGAVCEHLEAVSNGECTRLILNIPPRCMKPIQSEEAVWTINGWKAHGELRAGDYVFGPDGLPKRVLEVTPIVAEPSYEIAFDTRETIIAGHAHEWVVEREEGWERERVQTVVETVGLRSAEVSSRSRRQDRIRYAMPLWGIDADLPVDPYLFGCWLGDGERHSGHIGASAEDAGYFRLRFGCPSERVHQTGRNQPYHRFRIDGLASKLRVLGLGDKRSIPLDYLRASEAQRLALLQGLMDTDGHCTTNGTCVFSNTNRLLIDTVLHLTASLGLKVSCRERRSRLNGRDYGAYWQVSYRSQHGLSPFQLPRKAERVRPVTHERYRNRYVQFVRPVGERMVNCITVEGGVYLVGRGLIPTHNSLGTAVAWPAWSWAQEPDPAKPLKGPSVRFLSASYAFGLSVRDSRKCRLLLQSAKYQRYWSDRVELAGDQNAKARFENTEKGYRLSTSVEGTATGEGGDVVIIDDPLNAKEKESEVSREAVVEWWTQVMPTRLNDAKTGAFVIIMQRLHHNDLTGHILQHETGWTHLCLPMRYEHDHPHVWARDPRKEDGELLWEGKFSEEAVAKLEETLGTYGAAGQLQQRPSPREGGMFDRKHAQIVRAAPSGGVECRAWDLAGSTRTKSPWTAGVKMKRVKDNYYVEHVERDRTRPKQMHDMIVNIASQDGKQCTIDIPQDPGQAGKDQKRNIIGELAGYNARSSPETGSKETRAEPYSAQWEAGNVYLIEGAWNKAYLDELELFPNGDYSDQVDASSRAFARLSRKRPSIGGGAIDVS